MNTRQHLLVLAAFLWLGMNGFAQSISGTVTNENGETLSGAKVQLKGTYHGAYTNKEGKYHLSKVKTGSYEMVFSFLGFESQTKTVEFTGKDVIVDVALVEKNLMSEKVVVAAMRADEKTPTTYTNLSNAEVEKLNFGQDVPYLFRMAPSTVVTSDAGAGVGYTGMRIRGVDPSRTNVTINGIPLNDSESHGVWWVNMPDFTSSVDNIQIQRGVGTSSNGAAAFGASINIKTNEFQPKAYGVLDNSFGSFNTLRNTIKVGSGLINEKFTLDARLSRVSSDGYVDRASSDLKSFYISGAWVGKKTTIRTNVFYGKEKTYQAWWGTPESVVKGDEQAIIDFADRNWVTDDQRENLLSSGRTYNYYTYENETDNYQQDHYQLFVTHSFSPKLKLDVAGHYTYGRGYYEQYREDDDMSTYGFDTLLSNGSVTYTTDLIRRRWLDNQFYGGIFTLNYNNFKGLNLVWGGAGNAYDGDHFGEVIWAEFASQSNIRDRYYDNNSFKIDLSSYLKASYKIKKFTLYADVQYRHIDYTFLGIGDVSGSIVDIEQTVAYDFVNPKAGLMFDLNERNNIYASYSMANREPVRADFVEQIAANQPSPEQLQNIEVGYRLRTKNIFVNANYYLMNYKDQLILTGQINDVGGYTRTNVDKSYRMGVELEGGLLIGKKVNVFGNVTVSQNKIPVFYEYYDDYDNGGQVVIEHKNTDLAFSPNIISALGVNVTPLKGFDVNLSGKYVGEQFLDNTSNDLRKIDGYFISSLGISYSIKDLLFKEINIGFKINNLFNHYYENNGYTYSYLYGGVTTTENFYYPQAGINYLLRLTLKM